MTASKKCDSIPTGDEDKSRTKKQKKVDGDGEQDPEKQSRADQDEYGSEKQRKVIKDERRAKKRRKRGENSGLFKNKEKQTALSDDLAKAGGDTKPKKNDQRQREPSQSDPANKKSTTLAVAGGPMIIVHVNDRLGTKAAIPCLASDNIGLFKAQIAARIGRDPSSLMLRRQGERPFKDQLTLEDYGISNGVQLDLEIDTGA